MVSGTTVSDREGYGSDSAETTQDECAEFKDNACWVIKSEPIVEHTDTVITESSSWVIKSKPIVEIDTDTVITELDSENVKQSRVKYETIPIDSVSSNGLYGVHGDIDNSDVFSKKFQSSNALEVSGNIVNSKTLTRDFQSPNGLEGSHGKIVDSEVFSIKSSNGLELTKDFQSSIKGVSSNIVNSKTLPRDFQSSNGLEVHASNVKSEKLATDFLSSNNVEVNESRDEQEKHAIDFQTSEVHTSIVKSETVARDFQSSNGIDVCQDIVKSETLARDFQSSNGIDVCQGKVKSEPLSPASNKSTEFHPGCLVSGVNKTSLVSDDNKSHNHHVNLADQREAVEIKTEVDVLLQVSDSSDIGGNERTRNSSPNHHLATECNAEVGEILTQTVDSFNNQPSAKECRSKSVKDRKRLVDGQGSGNERTRKSSPNHHLATECNAEVGELLTQTVDSCNNQPSAKECNSKSVKDRKRLVDGQGSDEPITADHPQFMSNESGSYTSEFHPEASSFSHGSQVHTDVSSLSHASQFHTDVSSFFHSSQFHPDGSSLSNTSQSATDASSLSNGSQFHPDASSLSHASQFHTDASSLSHESQSAADAATTCPICGKIFYSARYIEEHMRTHTGEKPFHCPVCDRGFSLTQNLSKHMRIHTGEKKYSCPHCGKLFRDSQSMKRHTRIHTGERPYNCSECSENFRYREMYINHMKEHSFHVAQPKRGRPRTKSVEKPFRKVAAGDTSFKKNIFDVRKSYTTTFNGKQLVKVTASALKSRAQSCKIKSILKPLSSDVPGDLNSSNDLDIQKSSTFNERQLQKVAASDLNSGGQSCDMSTNRNEFDVAQHQEEPFGKTKSNERHTNKVVASDSITNGSEFDVIQERESCKTKSNERQINKVAAGDLSSKGNEFDTQPCSKINDFVVVQQVTGSTAESSQFCKDVTRDFSVKGNDFIQHVGLSDSSPSTNGQLCKVEATDPDTKGNYDRLCKRSDIVSSSDGLLCQLGPTDTSTKANYDGHTLCKMTDIVPSDRQLCQVAVPEASTKGNYDTQTQCERPDNTATAKQFESKLIPNDLNRKIDDILNVSVNNYSTNTKHNGVKSNTDSTKGLEMSKINKKWGKGRDIRGKRKKKQSEDDCSLKKVNNNNYQYPMPPNNNNYQYPMPPINNNYQYPMPPNNINNQYPMPPINTMHFMQQRQFQMWAAWQHHLLYGNHAIMSPDIALNLSTTKPQRDDRLNKKANMSVATKNYSVTSNQTQRDDRPNKKANLGVATEHDSIISNQNVSKWDNKFVPDLVSSFSPVPLGIHPLVPSASPVVPLGIHSLVPSASPVIPLGIHPLVPAPSHVVSSGIHGLVPSFSPVPLGIHAVAPSASPVVPLGIHGLLPSASPAADFIKNQYASLHQNPLCIPATNQYTYGKTDVALDLTVLCVASSKNVPKDVSRGCFSNDKFNPHSRDVFNNIPKTKDSVVPKDWHVPYVEVLRDNKVPGLDVLQEHKIDSANVFKNSDSSVKDDRGIRRKRPNYEKHCEINVSRNTSSELNMAMCRSNGLHVSRNTSELNLAMCNELNVTRNISSELSLAMCNVCGKNMKSPSQLQTHMRSHTGERPHACNHCGQAFAVLQNLHKHMRIHTGEQSFSCQYCERMFRCSQSRNRHVRLHTGEKPYKCTVCAQTFLYKHKLDYHKKHHCLSDGFEKSCEQVLEKRDGSESSFSQRELEKSNGEQDSEISSGGMISQKSYGQFPQMSNDQTVPPTFMNQCDPHKSNQNDPLKARSETSNQIFSENTVPRKSRCQQIPQKHSDKTEKSISDSDSEKVNNEDIPGKSTNQTVTQKSYSQQDLQKSIKCEIPDEFNIQEIPQNFSHQPSSFLHEGDISGLACARFENLADNDKHWYENHECDKEFEVLEKHTNNHIEINLPAVDEICRECGEVFDSLNELKTHMRLHII